MRLGLVIGEIAERNELKISQDEMRKALIEQARRFPARRRQSTNITRRRRARWPSCGRRFSRTEESSTSSSTKAKPADKKFEVISFSRRSKTPRRNLGSPHPYSFAVCSRAGCRDLHPPTCSPKKDDGAGAI